MAEETPPNNVLNFISKKTKVFDEKYNFIDQSGDSWFIFACSYIDMEGNTNYFNMWAKSFEDAKARINCIGNGANPERIVTSDKET